MGAFVPKVFFLKFLGPVPILGGTGLGSPCGMRHFVLAVGSGAVQPRTPS